MRIGIEAAHALRTPRSGVEEYCWQIIQHLKQVIPNDVEVVLYAHRPLTGALADLPSNWQAKILPWPLSKGWSQIRLSMELWRHPPDVFFAPAQLVPWYCPPHTAVMVHDSAFSAYPLAYRFFSRWYLAIMNQLIAYWAERVLVSSEFNATEFIRYAGGDRGQLVVVPLAYDADSFHPLTETEVVRVPEILAKYNVSHPFVMTIGRLEEKKNTARIIKAWSLARQQRPMQLLLAGGRIDKSGCGAEKIDAALQNSPFKHDIRKPGWVDAADLPYLLYSASALLFPSLYEGFGLPIVYAMAVGTPVITSRGLALEAIHSDIPFYVDPYDETDIARAITAVFEQSEAAEKNRAERGRSWVKQYSWSKTAKFTFEVLLRLSEKKKAVTI